MSKKTIKQVDATVVRDHLAEYMNRVCYGNNERIIIMRRGKPICAFVSLEDLDLLENIKNR